MRRILLLVERAREKTLLAEWLAGKYDVIEDPGSGIGLPQPFDLCILDMTLLGQHRAQILELRASQAHLFLPFLLVTPRRFAKMLPVDVWEVVDELILTPIEKIELAARVDSLIRTRGHSLDLSLRNSDLEAFVHAMTHDLKAPARTIQSYARIIFEDQSSGLGEQSQHYLRRIEYSATEMLELIAALLSFVRLDRNVIREIRRVKTKLVIDKSIRDLSEEIKAKNAVVRVEPPVPDVYAEPAPLKAAITGLLTNALKYVAPGIAPEITVYCTLEHGRCRINVRDNGIGIAPDDIERIFKPFVRLHGIEDYPGIGLGLSSVAKMVELMGGRISVDSTPGEGSIFSIELGGATD